MEISPVSNLDQTQKTVMQEANTRVENKPIDGREFARVLTENTLNKSELSAPGTMPETNSKADEVEKSLEKMMLSLLMKPMFQEFAEFSFGKGVEADHYTSLFSEAIADEITAGSSFGLGKYTENLKLDDKNPG